MKTNKVISIKLVPSGFRGLKKVFLLLLTCVTVTASTSCGGGGDINRLVEERDSLRDISRTQHTRLERLDNLISTINSSLDTIAAGEAGLFVNGVTGENTDARKQILGNIDRLATLISKQKSEIERLEARLADADEAKPDKNITSLIANYKAQLAEKDRQIAYLKEEISKKDADITVLNQRIGLQSKTIAELDRRTAAQNEALKRQDAMLNHCYMTIGTKKELEAKGIMKKGKLVAQSALDRSKFQKVDIRKFTEIQFSAKRPRIITPAPENSYELTTDGKHNYTLRITNPTAFWKISNYLVIQTN